MLGIAQCCIGCQPQALQQAVQPGAPGPLGGTAAAAAAAAAAGRWQRAGSGGICQAGQVQQAANGVGAQPAAAALAQAGPRRALLAAAAPRPAAAGDATAAALSLVGGSQHRRRVLLSSCHRRRRRIFAGWRGNSLSRCRAAVGRRQDLLAHHLAVGGQGGVARVHAQRLGIEVLKRLAHLQAGGRGGAGCGAAARQQQVLVQCMQANCCCCFTLGQQQARDIAHTAGSSSSDGMRLPAGPLRRGSHCGRRGAGRAGAPPAPS